MSYSEHNYEQVARYMDGENVSLDNTEQVLLNEVRDDMLAMGQVMDASVDSDVIERVLNRHRKSPWRTVAGISAAAAIVVVALAVWMLTMNNNPTPVAPAPQSVAVTNEVVDNLAAVQSLIEDQQELEIMAMLVQNDSTASTTTTVTSTEDDPWDMNAWANDLAG